MIDRISRTLVVLLTVMAVSAHAQDERVTFEDAKKTLTHAMLEYTIWPDEQGVDAFVIGLYGEDPELQLVLGEYMETVTVRDKPVSIRNYVSLEAARAAHVLLLAPSLTGELVEITGALEGSHTLIVTDGVVDDANIMANFTHPSRRRVAFELNAANVIAAGLTPTRDILMFGGDKNDLADAYSLVEERLARAGKAADEQQQQLNTQQQRLDEQQARLEEQQQRLDEQAQQLQQLAALDDQQARLEDSQRKLAALEGELGAARELLAEAETQLDQTASELAEKDKVLAEQEARLESYAQEVETGQQRLTEVESAAAAGPAAESSVPAAASETVSAPQGGAGTDSKVILLATAGVLLVLGLIVLNFITYRSRSRLMLALEEPAPEPAVANQRLVQLAESAGRELLDSAELLETTRLSKKQDEYVSQIIASAGELLDLTKDVGDLSRAEAGLLELDAIPFTLRDVLGDELQSLALQANEKGLELTFHIPPDIPDSLIGDPGRLLQLLDNLVGNAIEFTDSGEVAVDLKLESSTDQQVWVRFEVRDTGIGIAPEDQQKVFEPFTRLASDDSGERDGAGLGLAISDRIARIMGGGLSVRSVPGEGSTFYFSADFRLPDGPAPEARKAVKVLVVDDNSTNRMILDELLDSWGMSVTLAEGGEAALDELGRVEESGDGFAIALVDVKMPGMDGFELADRIRQRLSLHGLRILMLTSAGQQVDEDVQARLDISGVLMKPIKHSELQSAITEALGGRAEPASRPRPGGADIRKLTLVNDVAANREVAKKMLGKQVDPEEVPEDNEARKEETVEVDMEPADMEELEPLPPRTDLPCLDWPGALRNLEGDEDFLVELAENFLDEYPDMLVDLENAIESEEGEDLRRAGHALKGPAQLIGGLAVAEGALRLENLGHTERLAEAAREFEELQRDLDELKAALGLELSGQGNPDEPARQQGKPAS